MNGKDWEIVREQAERKKLLDQLKNANTEQEFFEASAQLSRRQRMKSGHPRQR